MLAENLSDIFQRGLEFAYDGEHQLIKELAKLVQAASSTELKNAFEEHLEQTRQHAERLERIFAAMNRAAAGETNQAISGISHELKKLIEHIERSPLLDAAIISNAMQLEHIEIALYASLCSFARVLGFDQGAALLEQTLSEEQAADHKLSEIAANSVNPQARGSINHPHGFVVI